MSYFKTKGDLAVRYGRKVRHLNNFLKVLAVVLCFVALGTSAFLLLGHENSEFQGWVIETREKIEEVWGIPAEEGNE